MAKYPSEIFGFYWLNKSREAITARRKRWCPFHGSKCYKTSRLVPYPFGVCTAHTGVEEIALCPRRFLQNNVVFRDIASHHFGTCDNILVFSEVGLKGIGNFDFVMVQHEPLSAVVKDFVVVEFQTGQTTGTGKLVEGFKEFMSAGTIPENTSYGFGINMYDIWKRTFTQILNKGIILEKWKRKIFWIVQEPVFNYFQQKYRIQKMSYSDAHSTVFALYDLKLKQESKALSLVGTRILSSTVDDLFNAFRRNDDIPPVDKFVARLQTKMSNDMNLALRIDARHQYAQVDAPRPTSTGRFREPLEEYDN